MKSHLIFQRSFFFLQIITNPTRISFFIEHVEWVFIKWRTCAFPAVFSGYFNLILEKTLSPWYQCAFLVNHTSPPTIRSIVYRIINLFNLCPPTMWRRTTRPSCPRDIVIATCRTCIVLYYIIMRTSHTQRTCRQLKRS